MKEGGSQLSVEIVFLGINDIGKRVYNWLVKRNDANVLALLTEPDQLSLVKSQEPDLLISAGFRHILPKEILNIPELGAVNFHKAYLPYNRGANPNVWSIIGNNPAGVSLHYMTPDVDAGPIIDRRKVPIRPDDNARDLYDRLEATQFEQFKEVWPSIRDGKVQTIEQDLGEGTYHYKKDFVDLWKIELDEEIKVGDFIDRLRALTFPPYKNAYFEKNGDKYYINIQITQEGEKNQYREAEEKNVPRYSEEEY